jgi:hypothetical protein
MGVPSAPNATGAVFAIRERHDAGRGAKPSWMRSAAVTATGVPNPAAPSKNAPRQNAMPITWMRGSGERRARLARRTAKWPLATVRSYRKMRLSTIQPIGNRPYAAPRTAAASPARTGIPIGPRATTRATASASIAATWARTRKNASAPSSTTTGSVATAVERKTLPSGS